MPSSPRRGSAVVPALAATRDAGARAGAAPSLSPPERLVVLAPNWLGDAVMALLLVADLRRSWPSTRIVVAARRSVAPLYGMVPGVDGTVVLEGAGGRSALHEAQANARRLREGAFDAALLLPNSFLAAWLAWRAGVRERWGFARDMRGRLLTRAIPRPRRYGHQVEYYQALAASLGLGPGEPFAAVHVPDAARARADDVLRSAGAAEGRPLVVFAPGAAYGRAKQWRPDRFAELASRLAADGIDTVLVGAKGDVDVCREIAASAPAIDLSGKTDLPTLAAVLARATAVVANDSGAMHLAAAVGARVIAIFGPTDERRTSPLRAGPDAPAPRIVAADVWCRRCMLRECPIDHRCMTQISARQVYEALVDAGPRHVAAPGA